MRLTFGMTVDLNGATLRTPASAGNSIYIFETYTVRPVRIMRDAPVMTIRNGILDGNKDNRGEYLGYELQTSSCVHFNGDPLGPGRLRVLLEDLTVINATGDGIKVRNNVDIEVRNSTCTDNYRGGLTITGGHSRVVVRDVVIDGTDPTPGLLNIEPAGSDMYGGEWNTDFDIDGLTILGANGACQIEAYATAEVRVRNLTSEGRFSLLAEGGTVHVSDSEIDTDSSYFGSHVYWPADVTLENCTIWANDRPGDGAAPWALGFYPNTLDRSWSNRTLTLRNCIFRRRPNTDHIPSMAVLGYYGDLVDYGDSNKVVFDGVTAYGYSEVWKLMAGTFTHLIGEGTVRLLPAE